MIDRLVIGASGQLGWHLYQTLVKRGSTVRGTYWAHPISGFDWVKLNISDQSQVEFIIQQLAPRVIYLPASFTNVDICEQKPDETRLINVKGVEIVVNAARKSGSKVVYFSSDYIFDGKLGPYTELSQPNPICEYGRQKLDAEAIVLNADFRPLVIRTTVLYSWEPQGKNFVMRLIRKLEDGEVVDVPDDQVGNPTYSPDAVQCILKLVDLNCTGVYNIAGSDRVNRYEFAREAARIFNLNERLIHPVSTSQLNQIAARPLEAGLISKNAENLLGSPIPGYRNGLRTMKSDQYE